MNEGVGEAGDDGDDEGDEGSQGDDMADGKDTNDFLSDCFHSVMKSGALAVYVSTGS